MQLQLGSVYVGSDKELAMAIGRAEHMPLNIHVLLLGSQRSPICVCSIRCWLSVLLASSLLLSGSCKLRLHDRKEKNVLFKGEAQ